MRRWPELLRSRAHVCRSGSFVRCSGRVRSDLCGSHGRCAKLLRSRADLLQQCLRWLWLQSEEALVQRLVRQGEGSLQEEPLLRSEVRWLRFGLRSDVRRSGCVRSELRRSDLCCSRGGLLPLILMPEPASVLPHG